MPYIDVQPEDSTIYMNGESLQFEFEAEEGLIHLRWVGEPETGHGTIEFHGEPIQALTPEMYAEEVQPYYDQWKAEKERLAEEKKQADAEFQKYLNSPEFLFIRLRGRIQERLQVYDRKIAQSQRWLRKAQDDDKKAKIEAQIAAWDAYADQLCQLTDKPGAPWNGGENDDEANHVPWPILPDFQNFD